MGGCLLGVLLALILPPGGRGAPTPEATGAGEAATEEESPAGGGGPSGEEPPAGAEVPTETTGEGGGSPAGGGETGGGATGEPGGTETGGTGGSAPEAGGGEATGGGKGGGATEGTGAPPAPEGETATGTGVERPKPEGPVGHPEPLAISNESQPGGGSSPGGASAAGPSSSAPSEGPAGTAEAPATAPTPTRSGRTAAVSGPALPEPATRRDPGGVQAIVGASVRSRRTGRSPSAGPGFLLRGLPTAPRALGPAQADSTSRPLAVPSLPSSAPRGLLAGAGAVRGVMNTNGAGDGHGHLPGAPWPAPRPGSAPPASGPSSGGHGGASAYAALLEVAAIHAPTSSRLLPAAGVGSHPTADPAALERPG